jgi:hypothetical protein
MGRWGSTRVVQALDARYCGSRLGLRPRGKGPLQAGRRESDYREVKFEREGKEPLHGRVDRGMVIVSGYGRHKKAAWLSTLRQPVGQSDYFRPCIAMNAAQVRAEAAITTRSGLMVDLADFAMASHPRFQVKL